MVALQKNLCSVQKQWYLQCFTHILASRFWELLLGRAPYINNTYKIDDMKWRDSQKTIIQLFLPYDAIKLKNWIHMENLFLNVPGKKKIVFQFYSFFRKYSRIVPEPKLKNWIHMENFFLNVPGKNRFSVLQFFLAIFRNSSRTKTEKLNPYGESLPGYLWKKTVFQCFSFGSGTIPE